MAGKGIENEDGDGFRDLILYQLSLHYCGELPVLYTHSFMELVGSYKLHARLRPKSEKW
jgi:hypothetical protein